MRRFLDSGKHYGPCSNPSEVIAGRALLSKKWTDGNADPTPNGPNGNFAFILGSLRQTIPSTASVAVAFKFKFSTSGGRADLCTIAAVSNNHQLQTIGLLELEPDGRISAFAGSNIATTSSLAISPGVWYTIEFNIQTGFNDITNEVSVLMYARVNGVQLFATGFVDSGVFTTGLLTGIHTTPTVTSIGFGGSTVGQSILSVPVIYDDFFHVGEIYKLTSKIDTLGPVMWVGDCDIAALFRIDDVLAEWHSTGGDNFSQINGHAPDLAKFVSSSTIDQKSAGHFDPLSNRPILTLQSVIYATKNDSGTRVISARSGDAATEDLEGIVALPDDPNYSIGGRDSNPATDDQWIYTDVNAKAFGFNLNA